MQNFQAKISVSLRSSVLDPAGEATKVAALKLGIEGIRKLRIGKSIDIEIKASNELDARKKLEVLCDRLLANPVIENWTFEIQVSDSTSTN